MVMFLISYYSELLLYLTIGIIATGSLFGYLSHKRALHNHEKAVQELKANEEYIKQLLDQVPPSGDDSLDTFRRLTLDTQLRGILEQKKANKLKEQEIASAVVNANTIASHIQNQTINNYNK